MRQAKVFFFVAAGVLMLAGAFHLGARSAQGQFGGTVAAVAVGNPASSLSFAIVADNGDIWEWIGNRAVGNRSRLIGNVFADFPPVQSEHTTWGRIKADRR